MSTTPLTWETLAAASDASNSRTPMVASVAVIAVLLGYALPSTAGEGTARDAPWFQPALTDRNNDPICDAFLASVRTPDPTSPGLKEVPGLFSLGDRSNSSVQSVPDRPDLLIFAQRGAKPLYVERIRNPGCGGACESESLGLHAALPSPGNQVESSTTPPAGLWGIYETDSGRQYVAGVVEHQLEVYRPSATPQWQLACRVQLEPDLDHTKDPQVRQAVVSLHALRDAAENMARDEGFGGCGTMHTPGRWRGDFEHALGQVLFDPQATAMTLPSPPSENSYGDYPRIYAALEEWSLGGLFEYQALKHYDAQLQDTTAVVGGFYQYGFHWTVAHSAEVAAESIRGAVSRLFGFYMYEPYAVSGERELRRALLEHQPMTAIRAVTVDLKALDQSNADSILNLAIEYPEALSYLLARGADPNHSNAFGKTPLMYAAQFDQLQAVQILLRAGADPNATTIPAPSDCDYAIRKHNVTPLHYAVKDASRQVIEALLGAGAVTYIRTEHYIDPAQGNCALEWLHEGNAKLSTEDVSALQKQLQVPSDAERTRLSITLTAAAEAANSEGKAVDAYRKIRLATLADPTNSRSTADFPLLALKAGAFGPALEANARIIANAKTATEKAAALFNQGLACQRATAELAVYNPNSYCGRDEIDPFLQAWKLQPSSPRVNKLVQLLGNSEPTNCAVSFKGGATASFRFYALFAHGQVVSGQLERIYALHPASVTINPSAIQWENPHATPPQVTNPHVVANLTLDQEHDLTILEGEVFPQRVVVNGKECLLDNSSSPRVR